MAKTIWKYSLSAANGVSLKMPHDAQILCIQIQNGTPCMWALVDPSADKDERVFNTYGTGHPFAENPQEYIGTYQLSGGTLVFHVFELLTPKNK